MQVSQKGIPIADGCSLDFKSVVHQLFVTCAGKISRNEQIVKIEMLLYSHSPSNDLDNDVRFVGI